MKQLIQIVSFSLFSHFWFIFIQFNSLDPVFNCSNNLLISSADKVTSGTYYVVYFISNVAFVGLLTEATAESASESAYFVAMLVITQFSDQVKTTFI